MTLTLTLTLANLPRKSDNILRGIIANVIDSCIEVIIGLPDIRMYRLIHRIPSYFDTPDPFGRADPFKRGTPGDEDTGQEAIDDSQWFFPLNKEYSYVQRIFTMYDLH